MKSYKKRIATVALSVMMAVNCAGCSAATDILDKFGIDLPFLSRKEQQSTADDQNTAEITEEIAGAGLTASEGATLDMENAADAEPAETELTPGEERRNSEGKILNIYCWDESLQSLFIMYYPEYEDIGERVGRIGNVIVNWVLPEEGEEYMELVAEKLRPGDLCEQ